MKIGTALIISLLAVVALVAEMFLYFFFGIGAAMAGGAQAIVGIAQFFVGLMVVTGALGVLAPLCAVVELVAKRKNLGYYLLLPALGVIAVAYIALAATSHSDSASPKVVSGSAAPSGAVAAASGSAPSAASSRPVSEESSYLDKVAAQNIKVGVSVLNEPAVYGEVKNAGDRTLVEVEITVYFLDKNGRRIHEKSYHPVLVSQFSFGDSNTPLKPGYSRKFGVKANDAPSEWARKVTVEVTNVKFSK